MLFSALELLCDSSRFGDSQCKFSQITHKTSQAFCDVMIKVGRDNGMQIAQPCYVKYLRENEIQAVCEEIKQKAGGNPIDLVYCILPRVSKISSS